MTQLRFTRCYGADSFATQVSVAIPLLWFSAKEILTTKIAHSLPLKEAIQIALQEVHKIATCSNFLRFPTHTHQLSCICTHNNYWNIHAKILAL